MLRNIEGRRRVDRERDGWMASSNVFDGQKFEQTLGDIEGWGSLACCSTWGCKELDTTEQQQSNFAYVFKTVKK